MTGEDDSDMASSSLQSDAQRVKRNRGKDERGGELVWSVSPTMGLSDEHESHPATLASLQWASKYVTCTVTSAFLVIEPYATPSDTDANFNSIIPDADVVYERTISTKL